MAKVAEVKNIDPIPDEVLMDKIYNIRGQKIMLDSDLAQLYGVETKRLKEQVKRNIERFPKHFMFELNQEEYNMILRSHFATLKKIRQSRYLPFAFTEHGVLMLSNVLKSQAALHVSIKIIDIFVKIRTIALDYSELKMEIETIKNEVYKQGERQKNHDGNLEYVFKLIDELAEKTNTSRKTATTMGFKLSGKY